MFVVLFIIFAILQLIGFFGVILENFCLTFLYVVIQLFTAVTDVIEISFNERKMIYFAVWSLFVSFISMLFLKDLYNLYQTKILNKTLPN